MTAAAGGPRDAGAPAAVAGDSSPARQPSFLQGGDEVYVTVLAVCARGWQALVEWHDGRKFLCAVASEASTDLRRRVRRGKTKLRVNCRWDWDSLELLEATIVEVIPWESTPLSQIMREHGGRFPAEFEAETIEEFIRERHCE